MGFKGSFTKRVVTGALYNTKTRVSYFAFDNFGIGKRGGGIIFAPNKQGGTSNVVQNIAQVGVDEGNQGLS